MDEEDEGDEGDEGAEEEFPLLITHYSLLITHYSLPSPQSPIPITPYPQRGPRVPQSPIKYTPPVSPQKDETLPSLT
ncbi:MULTISPECIES: hypothetical protein [unclassified Tolypothrix]|uniref:hypothetical protein n=1 Tax=unclassified Tolypothrix TaxID=2649714 RepID=UPI0005EAA7F3|nr:MULTISPECIES: hypothetical protein [unclassified Tolypothrix]EKF04019.1 hypothetical protein FDUTEX481_02844 [Tolypothrix sp. PCC 7601]UYD36020.1 hypothetical protein HG267_09875 [Tolypothrix sp. PCC 7601]BAY94387.1 hypothetical protein NIES3275_64350 [Microchaete diplosiphon NIES-3275]